MKTFHCDTCGQHVFFENVVCENCGSMLGYQPDLMLVNAYEAAIEAGIWRGINPANAGKKYKQCKNYTEMQVCNWMLDADSPHELCASCQLTQIIPELTNSNNRVYWERLESAKRRLLYTLAELNLFPPSKADDPVRGLAFEFLDSVPGGEPVLTGHADGLITLNIAEANPVVRERTREQMHEPYRTLLGHFRHESGHYYFDRLIAGTHWEAGFRTLFGDERLDYQQALEAHYANGPAVDWNQNFISSYAGSHPWEDWAESWAHYLHMIDTLETSQACGLSATPQKNTEPRLDLAAAVNAPLVADVAFDNLIKNWLALTYVLNSLSRSVGVADSYPFMLSPKVIEKLRFIDSMLQAQRP
ncbi:putative zinc-binding peptidase [Herbaspirillum sp. RTI4]|uniref:zinc-binding metallopeptidase family protein n=1 Tax=Herbaspirillum sp. RTI4 TaxID=3048640 RepID=UPI002AB3F64F|nr:putative zinc-binding peptidase [Herbaspirillum sp. RTI4]MDY7579059.1 putative zinc-binding peptidase [Herbaspirillum sp. RTI4]MEA9982356.1 putative zinc-binding peptidase [Herbaspirillum sp. RTI4]